MVVVEQRSRQSLFRLDPRTKLFLLFVGNITLLFSPGLRYEMVTVVLILLLGLSCGVYRYSIQMISVYFLLVAGQTGGSFYLDGGLRIVMVTFAVFLQKMFPCMMLGGILIATTRVNEFMAALQRLRLPRSIVIPLAVALRYFPAIKEEWGHIRDAMNMRGISVSFKGFIKNPLQIMECVYVPMMLSAAKIADELSAAAVTRGIDNPKPRTCLQRIGFGAADALCAGCFILWLAVVLLK